AHQSRTALGCALAGKLEAASVKAEAFADAVAKHESSLLAGGVVGKAVQIAGALWRIRIERKAREASIIVINKADCVTRRICDFRPLVCAIEFIACGIRLPRVVHGAQNPTRHGTDSIAAIEGVIL